MTATPTVATTVGVEGMDLVDGEHVLIADDPRAFADCMTTLLNDEDLWAKLAVAGRACVMERFSRDVIRRQFLEAIDAVMQGARRS
jgi:glycosyltransferase involved in cell wall biosynthesis